MRWTSRPDGPRKRPAAGTSRNQAHETFDDLLARRDAAGEHGPDEDNDAIDHMLNNR